MCANSDFFFLWGCVSVVVSDSMEKEKFGKLLEEEEEGLEVDDVIGGVDESFNRTLVGKLWTDTSYNVRAFKQTMIQAWRLKNSVDIQDLSKNLYMFKFSSKRDAEFILQTGPWSFDRNLLILDKISGTEQPSELDLHIVPFWVRIYDLPLNMRSDQMGKKIGDTIGKFVEADQRECNRSGRFLRIKVALDLHKPIKRGTILKYQGRNLWIFFKYERLPNFCFGCGRIGHQFKECEEVVGKEDGSYSEVQELDLTYGAWMRASPLPKIFTEAKKEPSSGTCSKSLFPSTSSSKCNENGGDRNSGGEDIGKKSDGVEGVKDKGNIVENVQLENVEETSKAVEGVAESLGTVTISKTHVAESNQGDEGGKKERKKWSRQKGDKNPKTTNTQKTPKVREKRRLVEVAVSEGNLEDIRGLGKKRHVADMEVDSKLPEVVLDDQHRLSQ